jgi:hypothetical protein
MADPRWTDETERLVFAAILGRTAPTGARRVLTALANAGLLRRQPLPLRPHPSRDAFDGDRGPTCSWCARPAMDPIHDPRRGKVLGAEIKAEVP